MTTNYRRGADVERRLVHWLRDRNWIAVRTPGSKGSFDVVAMRSGKIPFLFQCKRNGKIGEEELSRLSEDARSAGAQAYVVTPRRGGFSFLWVTLSGQKPTLAEASEDIF